MIRRTGARAGALLRAARRRAGLTQRALAARAGVPQPTIAALERGRQDPRFETLRQLLHGCGYDVDLIPVLGAGVDRTLIREQLRLSPAERARLTADEARVLEVLARARRRS